MRAAEARTSGLLWEVCRPELSPPAIRATAEVGIDSTRAATAAMDHGVAALLWRGLGLAGCRSVLDGCADAVRAEAELLRFQAMLVLPRVLSVAVKPLIEAGLEPLVFKGPALSMRYPSPGLRPMGDIDLILPKSHHEKALRTLGSSGWTVVRPSDRLHYDTVLTHAEAPGLSLELHHELSSWHDRASRLRAADLWSRRIGIDCLGTPAFGLSVEDEVVALAVHAAKPFHCFSRLIWIADVGFVISDAMAHGQIDWDLVRHRAKLARCETALAVTLLQAARIGVASPRDLSGIEASSTRRAVLAPLLEQQWPLTPLDTGLQNRLRYALADEALRRILLFIGAPVYEPVWTWPWHLLRVGLRAIRRWWRVGHHRRA